MAKTSTRKTVSRRKTSSVKKAVKARKSAKKPTRVAARKGPAKKASKPRTVATSRARKSAAGKRKAAQRKQAQKSSVSTSKATTPQQGQSKKTRLAKSPSGAAPAKEPLVPKPTLNRPGSPAEMDRLHTGMLGDGTEEQNLNQPGNPEARVVQEDVDIAFNNGEPDKR